MTSDIPPPEPPTRRRRRGIRWLLAVAVVAPLAILAGCSSGEASTGVASLNGGSAQPSASASAGDQEQLALKLAACIRQNGVPDFPDPTVDAEGNVRFQPPGNTDMAKARKAFQACEQYIDGLNLGGPGSVDRTELQDALLKYARCMRENGYDMADPDLSGPNGRPGPGGGPFGDVDRDDPAYKAANEKCEQHLAQLPGPLGGSR